MVGINHQKLVVYGIATPTLDHFDTDFFFIKGVAGKIIENQRLSPGVLREDFWDGPRCCLRDWKMQFSKDNYGT